MERRLAAHPHWSGHLVFQPATGKVRHEESGNRGTYEEIAEGVAISWERFGREIFLEVSGILTHDSLLVGTMPPDMYATRIGAQYFAVSQFSLRLPGGAYEVALRPRTSDIPTFEKIFIDREYAAPHLPADVRTIIDLGANIGLASVFFGQRYRHARILAVEPEPANFTLLEANTAAFGSRVRSLRAAVWKEDGHIDLHRVDEQGAPLGAWGIQVGQRAVRGVHSTACHRLDTLRAMAGFDTIDILKIDIEGAEQDIFGNRPESWLPHVRMIIIETHDRFRQGAEATVRAAVNAMFEELPRVGENLFFRSRAAARAR